MPIRLTAAMKDKTARHMRRTGASMEEASALARVGMIDAKGDKKHAGIHRAKRNSQQTRVTKDERRAFLARDAAAKGVTLGHDEDGYYVLSASRQSRRYATVEAIPVAVIREIEASG